MWGGWQLFLTFSSFRSRSIFSTTNMLDALQARANELWRTETRKTQVIYTSSNIRTTHEQIRKELAQKKDRQKKMLESELFNIKERPVPLVTPPTRYLTGLSCKFCTPGSSVSTFIFHLFSIFCDDVCLSSFAQWTCVSEGENLYLKLNIIIVRVSVCNKFVYLYHYL